MKTEAGQNAFAVLLFQDMAVIPMLALMPLLAIGATHGAADAATGHGGGHTPWVETLPPWGQALAVLGAVAVVVAGGRFLTSPLFRFIASARLREVFTAAALLLVIGIALLMTRVGLSPALGTFLAGVVLANSEYRHELEGDIEPFKGLLLGLFFISVGASIDFQLIGNAPGQIAMLVVGLVVLKLAVLFALAKGFKMSLDQGLLFTFALAQGGEFAFVLVSFATQSGIFGTEVSAPLIAAVAVSMALTPLLLMLAEKVLLPRFGTLEDADAREPDAIDEENPVIIAGFGRTGAVVGRFLRANGVRPTILDLNSEKVEVLRKVGIKVFADSDRDSDSDSDSDVTVDICKVKRSGRIVLVSVHPSQVQRILDRGGFFPLTFYADGDGDGFGDAATTATACVAPPGFVEDDTDCDDTDAAVPGPETLYDDVDGDGFGDPATGAEACPAPGLVADGTDCDDADAAVNPGAEEILNNGVDDDCDPATLDCSVTCADAPPCPLPGPFSTLPACDETQFLKCTSSPPLICSEQTCPPGFVFLPELGRCGFPS